MSSDSKANMVRSAASLISAQGVSATSFADVLADSGAPRGSIYHHFPEGKEQLAQDAIRWTSERVVGHLRACPAGTAAETLAYFIDMWRTVVKTSHARAGCAVAGVAVDTAAEDTALLAAVRTTFKAWSDLLGTQLVAAGIERPRARSIAVTALAAMEGALILCRAEGSVRPLDAVAGELMRLVPER